MQKLHWKLYLVCYFIYYKHAYTPEYKKKHADYHSKIFKKLKHYEEYSTIKLRFLKYVYILLIRAIYKAMKNIAKN